VERKSLARLQESSIIVKLGIYNNFGRPRILFYSQLITPFLDLTLLAERFLNSHFREEKYNQREAEKTFMEMLVR